MCAKGAPNQISINTIRDKHGNIVLEASQNEYVVISKDGTITSYTQYNNITLVCGTIWNPTMMYAKPPILVGVCETCRESRLLKARTHGLVAMHMAKLCVCGALVCPSHRRLGKDGKWRCPGCHSKYMIKNLLKPLFFKRIED